MARIVVVDDHPLVADSLARALREHGHDVAVVDPDSAHEAGAFADADAAVLDLDLGATASGRDLIAPLVASGATVAVVTGSTDEAAHGECLLAGAAHVVSKSRPFDQLVATLDDAFANDAAMAPRERDRLIDLALARRAAEDHRKAVFADLTHSEQRVLQALVEGLQAAEIAETQFISMSTVRTHIRHVLAKLGVNSQVAAVSLATRHRFTPDKT